MAKSPQFILIVVVRPQGHKEVSMSSEYKKVPVVSISDVQRYSVVRELFESHDVVLVRDLKRGVTEGLLVAPRAIKTVIGQVASVKIGDADE